MRLLLVEDEKKIVAFLRRGLREEGYAVDVASDGEQADDLASVNEYDLIILDLMLPKVDGLSVCRTLRQRRVDTPILMLTARDTVTDKVAGLDAGADDYLTKPFAFEELLARIRSLLRRKSGVGAVRLETADLVMDLVAHSVTRAGRAIPLTQREFSLLEYLLRHAGEVVTRTMISEHVWDLHDDVSSNVIDVYITYLRAKIDEGHSHKLIHTVRGRGYSLKA